jgi:hypothetical protein
MNIQGRVSGKDMPTVAVPSPVPRSARWLGRGLSGLVILFLLVDAAIKLVPWPVVTETMDRIGYGSSETLARALGVITVACTVLYAIPPTSILGAILLTDISAARWPRICGSAARCSPTRCSGSISG